VSENRIDISKNVTVEIDGETRDGVMRIRANTDAGFSKLWIDAMMTALGITGSSKAKVIGYLMENRDSNNRVHGTFDEIAEATKTGRMTVARTLKAMQKAELVEKEYDGVYLVSPSWVWTGSHSHRMTIIMEFENLRHPGRKRYGLDRTPSSVPTPEGAAAE